jgi:hypothetical protein
LTEIDTFNKFMVGMRGNTVVVMRPTNAMSRMEALVFAAYLVTLADPAGDQFAAVLDAVQST